MVRIEFFTTRMGRCCCVHCVGSPPAASHHLVGPGETLRNVCYFVANLLQICPVCHLGLPTAFGQNWTSLKYSLAGTLGQGSGEAALARKLPAGHTVPSRPRGRTDSEELFHFSVDLYQICHAWHLTMDDCPAVFSGIEQVSTFRYQRPLTRGGGGAALPAGHPAAHLDADTAFPDYTVLSRSPSNLACTSPWGPPSDFETNSTS